MKQEWFESNDFAKTTSKNKPEEQAQEVADKVEETIVDLDIPIEKNTQVEEEVSQAEVELENQQEETIETPEDSESRTEIEEKKALDSTEEEQDLSKETEKVTIAEESQEALPQQKPTTKEPLLISQSLESPYIPDQAPKSTDRWKEQNPGNVLKASGGDGPHELLLIVIIPYKIHQTGGHQMGQMADGGHRKIVLPVIGDHGNGSNGQDRKSTRLNSSHITRSRMPSSA